MGDHCWLYRISVGTWIFLALAWLAGVIGTIQDGFQMLISKSDSATEVGMLRDDQLLIRDTSIANLI